MSGRRASHMACAPAYTLREAVLFAVALTSLAAAIAAGLMTGVGLW